MKKIFMVSLGCAKNLVDAESMLGETLGDRFALAVLPEEADLIIINTCAFIEPAREEGRAVIQDCLDMKKRSGGKVKVAVAGCWAQRDPEGLARAFPAIDALWGLSVPSGLAENIDALFRKNRKNQNAGAPDAPLADGLAPRSRPRDGARLVTTLPSFAYLRLSDGCDNRCAYCAIPLIRGGLRTRPAQDILDEAKILEDQGAKELVLIAQDTTAYAAPETDGNNAAATLHSLLRSLLDSVAVPRLRLLYAHPAHLTDDVIDLLLAEPRLCGYLDLPLQHAADSVLRAMGRGYGRERIDSILARFAGRDFTLRTTFLLGFPGETEKDFGQVLDLVDTGAFRHVGAFAYSPEPGTPAFSLPDAVPPAEAESRLRAVMETQEEHAFGWLDSRVGGVEDILVDEIPEPGLLLGRSRHEAPDADNAVYIEGGKAQPGDIVKACVVYRDGYDVFAETDRARLRKQTGKTGKAGKTKKAEKAKKAKQRANNR